MKRILLILFQIFIFQFGSIAQLDGFNVVHIPNEEVVPIEISRSHDTLFCVVNQYGVLIKDSLEDGIYVLNSTAGITWEIFCIKNTNLHGEYIHFYENGNLKLIENYRDGDGNGIVVRYSSTGKISETG